LCGAVVVDNCVGGYTDLSLPAYEKTNDKIDENP